MLSQSSAQSSTMGKMSIFPWPHETYGNKASEYQNQEVFVDEILRLLQMKDLNTHEITRIWNRFDAFAFLYPKFNDLYLFSMRGFKRNCFNINEYHEVYQCLPCFYNCIAFNYQYTWNRKVIITFIPYTLKND